jgi:hypothetical protein
MGSQDRILIKSKYFFSFMQLPCCYFTLYKELQNQSFVFFWKSITLHHCITLLQVALMLIPPKKFVRLPCWYYWWYEIVKYDFRVVPNGITSIPNSIQIHLAVFKLNHADRQTWPALYALSHAHYAKNAWWYVLPKWKLVRMENREYQNRLYNTRLG